jgi:hypothetical protein
MPRTLLRCADGQPVFYAATHLTRPAVSGAAIRIVLGLTLRLRGCQMRLSQVASFVRGPSPWLMGQNLALVWRLKVFKCVTCRAFDCSGTPFTTMLLWFGELDKATSKTELAIRDW